MTRVIVVAEENCVPREPDVVKALVSHGHQVMVERDVCRVKCALASGELHGAVLVVDKHTVSGKGGLAAYKAFMHAYGSAKAKGPLGIIMVTPMSRPGCSLAGWGDLVDAYIFMPPDPEVVATYVDRILLSCDDL